MDAVTVRGVRLAYREHTRPAELQAELGPPVLALHGLASTGATWDRFGADLARRGRRVIAPDLRGHGGSARGHGARLTDLRDDALGLLDALGIDTVDVVGHSLGAYTAMLMAVHQPGRIRRLVLEDPPSHARPGAGDLAVQTEYLKVRRILRGMGGLLLVTRLRQFDVRMARPVLDQLRTPDDAWWDRLAAVSAPTLILGAGRSHVPQAKVARIAATIPDSRLVLLDQAGHRIHSTEPAAFAEAVVPFLCTVFDAVGGMPAFLRLAEAHHARCLADPVLEHPFSHTRRPDHAARLGRYWAEVFGGPPARLYPESPAGSQLPMLRMHAGAGMEDGLGERFRDCFEQAMDDARLPPDPRLRSVLRDYLEWAVADVVAISGAGGVAPPEARMPRWSWDGRER